MTKAYTPGPWQAILAMDGTWAFHGNSPHGPIGWLKAGNNSAEENEANARLIAAAPELVAACEMALALLCGTGQDGTLGHHPDNPVPSALRAVLAKVKELEEAKHGSPV